MKVKLMTTFWWALNPTGNLMFYGTGDAPTEHHSGHSTPVVSAKRAPGGDGDRLLFTTKSGSHYLLRQGRMFPNIHVALALTRLLGE